jgi:hypothetical protein
MPGFLPPACGELKFDPCPALRVRNSDGVRGGLLNHFRGWITRLSHRRRRPRCRRASKTAFSVSSGFKASPASSSSGVPVAWGRVNASDPSGCAGVSTGPMGDGMREAEPAEVAKGIVGQRQSFAILPQSSHRREIYRHRGIEPTLMSANTQLGKK